MMNLKIIIFLLLILSVKVQSQDLSIEETLRYISNNTETYFNVDSDGNIYNDRYKFNAFDVGASTHLSSAVRIMCTRTSKSEYYYFTEPPKCIKCLRKNCYEGTYGGQSSTNDIYINVDSSYDQKRIMNAIDHLIKKVKEKYPKKKGNDPFVR